MLFFFVVHIPNTPKHTGSNFKIHSRCMATIRYKNSNKKGIAPFLRRSIFENWSRSHDRSRQLLASSLGSFFFLYYDGDILCDKRIGTVLYGFSVNFFYWST